MSIRIRTLDGREHQLLPQALEALAGGLRGSALTQASPGYDAARAIWNGMVDRRPAVIVQCAGAADVRHAVRFASEYGLLVSVRGGGHNIAGNAVCEGGLMIDLSAMRGVRVDAATRSVRVQPGCTLADVDHETQAFGLALPVGVNSTTGIAGLTLGGGFGWITRRYGMTIDNLLSADVVTASGELLHATETQHPELFWALRGGGGNFGVVTDFQFNLHPVGPQVLAGLILHPLSAAPDLLRYYRQFAAAAPDELTVWVVLRKAPPLPFLAPQWHGREVAVIALCYIGSDIRAGERLIAPLRAYGRPVGEAIGTQPFAAWQKTFDPLLAPGARNYWKSHDFAELTDGAVDTFVECASQLPTSECELFIAQMGGAMARVPTDRTAYPHRATRYTLNVHTRWQDRARDAECVGWARQVFDRTARYATGGVYVNFMPADESERVPAAYGPNYERLARTKRQYDPENLFRMNQNIAPLAAAPGRQEATPPSMRPRAPGRREREAN